MRESLNLARQPFQNSRPVVRSAVLLWVLGGSLLAANLWFYAGYLADTRDTREQLAQVEQATADARRETAELEDGLAAFGLAEQNQRVAFLNHKIEERTLAWSRLFDQLAGLLPDDVRLLSLSPEISLDRNRQGAAVAERAGGERTVPLKIFGEAKTDEALLALVDALFAHPAFKNPSPGREARAAAGPLRFDLTVVYLPAVAEQIDAAEQTDKMEEPATEGAAVPGETEGEDGAPATEGAAAGADSEGETT